MSERITGELRDAMNVDREYTMGGDVVARTYCMGRDEFTNLCDAIDSIHANLERENDRLKCELDRVLGELDEMHKTDGISDKCGSAMHEVSITDELREEARGIQTFTCMTEQAEQLLAIADRIDAEHQRQLEVLYRDMSDAEYVKLHKDTGGEYIHEHDKVDWRDHACTWHENATVVAVCNDGCYVMDGTVFHVHKSDIRHHHDPTVEDVLRGVVTLCHNTWKEGSAFEFYDVDDVMKSGNIADFAAKLRLAEDANAK